MRKPAEPTYRLTVTPQGDGPPGDVRLRRALKCLGRSFGLKCVGLEEVPAGGASGAEPGKGDWPGSE